MTVSWCAGQIGAKVGLADADGSADPVTGQMPVIDQTPDCSGRNREQFGDVGESVEVGDWLRLGGHARGSCWNGLVGHVRAHSSRAAWRAMAATKSRSRAWPCCGSGVVVAVPGAVRTAGRGRSEAAFRGLGLSASIAPESRHDAQERNRIVLTMALDDAGQDRRDIPKILKLIKYRARQFCLGITGEVGAAWGLIRDSPVPTGLFQQARVRA